MHEVALPDQVTATTRRRPAVPEHAPDFVQRVTARIIEGHGDLLPVSALPVDGTFPTGTSRYERRSIAVEVPIWDPDICTQCALCAIVCPHASIRVNAYDQEHLAGAPDGFKSVPWKGKDPALEGFAFTVQLAPDDCTGCGVCVDVCPARSKSEVKHKAINMEPKGPHLEVERAAWDFFREIPEPRPSFEALDAIKASQLREPLFEFSGACAGCGETPYLKLVTQLFGDRMVVANATGCSSIYGGNLPTTPWAQDARGRGPAWSNSLFEDNAEFGLGMRLAIDAQRDLAITLVERLRSSVGDELASALLDTARAGEAGDDAVVAAQRERVVQLREALTRVSGNGAFDSDTAAAARLARRRRRTGPTRGVDRRWRRLGLRHRQCRARPRARLRPRRQRPGARHRGVQQHRRPGLQGHAARRHRQVRRRRQVVGKKDLGMIAMAYGNVYVGADRDRRQPHADGQGAARGRQLAGAVAHHRLQPLHRPRHRDVDRHDHQRDIVRSGYWPLYRYDPRAARGEHDTPLTLDSAASRAWPSRTSR
jgi:pyruvate-ferredoxin/flavodoxin oxidoreductase